VLCLSVHTKQETSMK